METPASALLPRNLTTVTLTLTPRLPPPPLFPLPPPLLSHQLLPPPLPAPTSLLLPLSLLDVSSMSTTTTVLAQRPPQPLLPPRLPVIATHTLMEVSLVSLAESDPILTIQLFTAFNLAHWQSRFNSLGITGQGIRTYDVHSMTL